MSKKSKYGTFLYILKIEYKFVYVLFFYVLCAFPAIAQTVYIKGFVELQDSISDPVYNLVALKSDSSIYKGQVYIEPDFLFEVDCDSIICIKFLSLGYEPLFYSKEEITPLISQKNIQLGKIQLKSNAFLEEITVTARKKSLSISPTGYSVDIKNSYLSTYGTFNDVIKRIPGITLSPRGDVGIIGKSNPLFILNGRRLTSTSDLERLDPKQIKTIHVDQNPGPEYDASYDAVVRVETMDYSQEFYSVDLRNRFEYARRPSNYSRVIVQRKDKNFVYGIEMQYNVARYKQYDTENKFVWTDNDSINGYREAVLSGKTRDVILTPSLLWTIDKNNRLEAIYRFNFNQDDCISDQDYISHVLGEKEFIETYTIESNKKYIHNPSLFYIFEREKHRFQLSADYYIMNTNFDQKVKETYTNEVINNDQDFKDKYEIFGGTADYKTKIGKWQISTGGKISGIKDKGKYYTNDDPPSSSLLKDNTYALYLSSSGKISSFSFSAALRAEWNNINYSNTSYKENVKSHYFNLFPSASIRYGGDKITTSLAYNKNISRPSFSQLNPNRRYLDPISYMVGNPFLKSRITHNLALSIQHADLIIRATYSIQNNPQAGILELTPDNMIAYTNTNMPKSKLLSFVAIYSLDRNWFRSNFVLRARFQDIRFQDRIYSKLKDNPGIIGNINIDFDLWKNGSLNINGFYYSNYRNNVVKMKNSGYVSFELNQSFCKSKWRLTGGVEDIFNIFRPNSWERYLKNASVKMDTNADSRYFYFTLQYRIGKMKTSKKSNSIISDEKNRL